LALVTISGITPVKMGAMFLAKKFYGSLDFGEFQRKTPFLWREMDHLIPFLLSFFFSLYSPSDCQEPKNI